MCQPAEGALTRCKWGSHGRDTEAVVATKYLSAMLPPVRVCGRNMEAVVATKYLHTAPHTALRMELPSEGDIRGLEHILGRLRQSPDNRLCYQDAARAAAEQRQQQQCFTS